MRTSTDTAIKNDVVTTTLAQYASLHWTPQPGKHTVLAGFTLHDPHSGCTQLLACVRQRPARFTCGGDRAAHCIALAA